MAKPTRAGGTRPPRAAASSEPPARRARTEPIGALLPSVGGMAFRRFGFAQGALVGHWAEIVGPIYARWSVPESIRFPRGRKGEGTLTIRVEGPFSLQLQHVAPQIIARANRVLGASTIAHIRLVQGDVPKPEERPLAPKREKRPAPGNLAAIGDEGLRQALEALASELDAGGAVPPGVPKVR